MKKKIVILGSTGSIGKGLLNIIDKDKRDLHQLSDKDSLEHFARENYGHKKEDETIFYIEFEDGLDLK